jgi:hypothetical protein
MGSLALSLVSFAPLFILASALIRKYRENILVWVRQTRIMQALQASKFYETYKQVSGWTT